MEILLYLAFHSACFLHTCIRQVMLKEKTLEVGKFKLTSIGCADVSSDQSLAFVLCEIELSYCEANWLSAKLFFYVFSSQLAIKFCINRRNDRGLLPIQISLG